MKSRRARAILYAVALAAVLCVALEIGSRIPGKHWYTELLLPAWAVGTWVSGNVHQPDSVVSSLVVFLMTVLIACPIAWLLTSTSRHRP
jgi:hypothetical protein